MRIINSSLFLLLLIFSGCASEPSTFIYRGMDMKGTINIGDKLNIDKQKKIESNDVIAFKLEGEEIRVLRVVGVPGDVIEIDNGDIFRNQKFFRLPPLSKKVYVIYCKDSNKFNLLDEYEFNVYSATYSTFSLSEKEYRDIVNSKIPDSIYPIKVDSSWAQKDVIKNSKTKYNNIYYLGPIEVPKPNSIVTSDILGILSHKQNMGTTLKEKQFFCIGDNFPSSRDSRFIGLVSEKDILGVVSK